MSDELMRNTKWALLSASREGNLTVVKQLIEQGVEVNSQCKRGFTALHCACINHHVPTVRFLLQHGANVNKSMECRVTPLMISVNNYSLCELLLRHNPKLNKKDNKGRTALHLAVEDDQNEVLELLLDNGANPTLENDDGDDILWSACNCGNRSIVDLLVKHVGYPWMKVAQAYELLGSTYAINPDFKLPALESWKTSLTIRKNYCGGVLEKFCSDDVHITWNQLIINGDLEFRSTEELQNISSDSYNMKIQAILICKRILGPLHFATIHKLSSTVQTYDNFVHHQRCVDVLLYELSLSVMNFPSSNLVLVVKRLVHIVLKIFKHFGASPQGLRSEDVITLIDILTEPLETKKQLPVFDYLMDTLLLLLYVLHNIPKTRIQELKIQKLMRRIITAEIRSSNGNTLLHMAIYMFSQTNAYVFLHDSNITISSCHQIVELLLMCGHQVNVINQNGESPLNLAVQIYNSDVVDSLLNFGAE